VEAVRQSVIVLKALSYAPTGGIVAAPTTSLPEHIGGPRNWDYRYCWIRDATFTLYALLISGFLEEAQAWREWLLRAVAGQPAQLQIMYGLAGERQLPEREIPWLAGYEGSRPVRIGNAAHSQFQLDVYGEIADAFHVARRYGIESHDDSWRVEKALLDFLESAWRQADEGIWEVRGPRRHFTHSKVMAWVAADRAIKAVERFGLEGPIERWRALRATIHAQVCRQGFSSERNAFVQFYGGRTLDAALLMIPLVGFLPAGDPRAAGTVAAIERELMADGLVRRYSTASGVDGLPAGEGAFLACTFWLADNYAMMGRYDEARTLFERLLALRNDVGLLAEEYDPRDRRQLGNFPQAFSHVALINTAHNLTTHLGPADSRAERGQAAEALGTLD
jgi:GH15 family glucan-1,4-alpha-glucosidase